MSSTPVVLLIGGFDGSSGAGVAADLRMVQRMGGYGIAALTALTIQDHRGFFDSSPLDDAWIRRQIEWLLDHYPVKAVKIGMLARSEAVRVLIDSLLNIHVPLVIDPVLCSSTGAILLNEDGRRVMSESLLPAATLITPNLMEAQLLGSHSNKNLPFDELALLLSQQFGTAVLLKGGHVMGASARDLLVEKDGTATDFTGHRVEGINTHGTGCRLASAVATALALGVNLKEAVSQAKDAQNLLFLNPLELEGYGPVLG